MADGLGGPPSLSNGQAPSSEADGAPTGPVQVLWGTYVGLPRLSIVLWSNISLAGHHGGSYELVQKVHHRVQDQVPSQV